MCGTLWSFQAVGSKCVFKVKTAANGSIQCYKARLVAQGFSQKYGLDYVETFCPVVKARIHQNRDSTCSEERTETSPDGRYHCFPEW